MPAPRRTAPAGFVDALESRTLFAAVPAGFVDDTLATGLTNPTAMEFAPDGRLFVAQQGGQLRVVRNGMLLAAPFASLTVDSAGERGLLGVAFDPDYAANRFVYVYHTVPAPGGGSPHNRVTRFTADPANPDVAVAGSATPILDLDDLSGATNHNGGAIHFGLDGKLYVAVGDNANGNNAQTLANRHGKMLRINADGSIPADNPFYATATGANRAIWALGLRNPYTFAVQPGTGTIHINDVGQNTWEEVNVGVAGANYGWPGIEGPRTTQPSPAGYVDPLYAYRHPFNGSDPTTVGYAVTGGTFYNPATPSFPVGYAGDYFVADLANGWVRKLEAGTGTSSLFATNLSTPVDLKVGPDGRLYYLERGNGGRVGRVTAATPAVTNVAVNGNGTAAQRSRVTSLTVTFSRPVTLDAGAITLVGRNGAGAGVTVAASGTSSIIVTFGGPGLEDGSLPDGVYDLRVSADRVHDVAVPAQTPAADYAFEFHRLYSDADGDGDSDNADLFQFRSSYGRSAGDPAYRAYFDFDGDGDVDNADLFQVRSRRSVEFKGY